MRLMVGWTNQNQNPGFWRTLGVCICFCPDLTEIKIPASVTNIDGNPFAGCSGLELIEVDGNNPNIILPVIV